MERGKMQGNLVVIVFQLECLDTLGSHGDSTLTTQERLAYGSLKT